jgi:hypothetical protein
MRISQKNSSDPLIIRASDERKKPERRVAYERKKPERRVASVRLKKGELIHRR